MIILSYNYTILFNDMIMYVYISIYVYNTIQSYHMETNGKTMIESCFWYLDFIANLDYLVAVGRLSLGPSWLRIWPRNVEFQWVSPSFLWAKRVGSWGLHSCHSFIVEKWYGWRSVGHLPRDGPRRIQISGLGSFSWFVEHPALEWAD